jgi:putative DNA primase/helicase
VTVAPRSPSTLTVESLGGARYLVTGGAEPHCVTLHPNGPLCDCKAFQFGDRRGLGCKHLDAVSAAQASGHIPPALEVPDVGDVGPGAVDQAVPPPDPPPAAPEVVGSIGRDPMPPGSVPDTERAAPSTATIAAPATRDDLERFSDLGNARRLVRLHGADLRHVRAQRRWLLWDERRWRDDATGEADRRAKAVVDQLYADAAAASHEAQRKVLVKHAVASDSAQRVRSMLELASTESAVVLRVEQLDAGPWVLNLQNGTLDLRNGELRPHRRADYLTKLAPVRWDPGATAPRWARFLREITGADQDLAGFLQRAIGYSLTGDTGEQCLFFCHGQGANGKTVFLETVQAMLGPDYARTAAFEIFLDHHKRQAGAASPDLARLRGVRLVSASEAPGGLPLDEALIKQLVGGDTIAARHLYQETFEFRPAFKIWLRANHKPPVREQTHAFWRRMRLVPFGVTIPEARRERALAHHLRAELPGILAWAVRGCTAWQRDGLGEPAIVRQATAAYRAENDTFGEFLEARGTLDPHAWTATADLYKAFGSWWDETHGKDRAPSRNWFTRALAEAGLHPAERGHAKTRGWCGVRITGALPTAGIGVEREPGDDALPF